MRRSALPSGLAHGLDFAGMWELSTHFKHARRCAGFLGWEEIKFKTCARLSRQRLSSRILGFPFLHFPAPHGTSVLQSAGRGKSKVSISELCLVVGQRKCWDLVLETVA